MRFSWATFSSEERLLKYNGSLGTGNIFVVMLRSGCRDLRAFNAGLQGLFSGSCKLLAPSFEFSKNMKPSLLAFVLLIAGVTQLNADVVLYDSALGTTPGGQGWISIIDNDSSESISGGLLNLDTSADQDDQSGYASESTFNGALEHPNMPLLDLSTGFTIRFDLQIVSESHINRDDNNDGKDDRAGFSLITISENLQGLELAFFENRIWAYADSTEGTNSLFTQAEGVTFDTTAAVTTYDLVFQTAGYELFANGNSILTGGLRNYNPSGVPALINPYDNPSFLFFGDDTSSASSHSRIGTVQVIHPVPEPASLGFVVLMMCVAATIRLKSR
jgi:hypothetical protein